MSQINYEILSQYFVDAADIKDAKTQDLPLYGDNVKILVRQTQSQVLEKFVFIFNFSKGNYIRISTLVNKRGDIVETVSKLLKPLDILEVYVQIKKQISEKN